MTEQPDPADLTAESDINFLSFMKRGAPGMQRMAASIESPKGDFRLLQEVECLKEAVQVSFHPVKWNIEEWWRLGKRVIGAYPTKPDMTKYFTTDKFRPTLTAEMRKLKKMPRRAFVISNDRIAEEFVLSRVFFLSENRVEHTGMLMGHAQGEGKKLFRNQLQVYDAIGITRVTITTSHIGTYAWLKYGFLPHDHRGLAQEIYKRAIDLIDEREIGTVDSSDIRSVAAIEVSTTTSDVPSIRKDTRFFVNPDTGRFLLGKYLLLERETGWSGVLDLQNAKSRSILENYIGS